MAIITPVASQVSVGNLYSDAIVYLEDTERNNSVTIERVEHLDGETSFFLDARDSRSDGPQLRLTIDEAEQLRAWLTDQLAK